MTALRSAVFLVVAVVYTIFFGLLVPLSGLFSRRAAHWLASEWARWTVGWVRLSCGLNYRVHGAEHVPSHPVVIMAKHQSGWETVYLEASFPYQCWIIKRELLWLPFVGWGLKALQAIEIGRAHV